MFIVIIAIVLVFALLISCCLLSGDVPSSENTLPSEDIDKVYKVENTPKSCYSENTSLSANIDKVYKIEIIPEFCYLIPNEEKVFKIKATNLITGEEVSPGLIQWQAVGGAIDDRGKLIVDSQSKGIFYVTATSHDYNLVSLVKYSVLPKLKNIEIITTKEIVMPGQAVYLELRGTDQTRAEINIEGQPIWSTTTGSIGSHNKLVVDLPNRIVYITAKIGGLVAKTTIRVGELPQKVVNPIYPIDIPNLISETTPTQDKIFIPIVSDYYPEDELLKNEPEQIKESSRLVSLEIDAPDLIFLKPSQERVFTARGIDQFGKYIDPGKILWRATGGAIDSQGRLIVENDAKGSFRVTAISSNAKVSQHRLRQNLLLIKISLRIFSWVLSHKKFVKDSASYFVQEFCDSEVLVNEIFPEIDTSKIDGFMTLLVFDDIKERIIEAAINIIIDYLDKFVALCFGEESSSLTCSVDYVILPELRKLIIHPSNIDINPGDSVNFHLIGIDQKGDKIEIERKVIWKATGGGIDRKGKLTVNSNSQGIFRVTATVGNSLNTSIYYNTLHYRESFEVTAVVENESNISIDCNTLQDVSSVSIASSGGISIASYNKELREREIGKNYYRHTNK